MAARRSKKKPAATPKTARALVRSLGALASRQSSWTMGSGAEIFAPGRDLLARKGAERAEAIVELFAALGSLPKTPMAWVRVIFVGGAARKLLLGSPPLTDEQLVSVIANAARAPKPRVDEPDFDRALVSLLERRKKLPASCAPPLQSLCTKYAPTNRYGPFDYASDRRLRERIDRLLAR